MNDTDKNNLIKLLPTPYHETDLVFPTSSYMFDNKKLHLVEHGPVTKSNKIKRLVYLSVFNDETNTDLKSLYRLQPLDMIREKNYGECIFMSSSKNKILIGSPYHLVSNNKHSGKAYIYDWSDDESQPTLEHIFKPPVEHTSHKFGHNLAMNLCEDIIIVTCYSNSDGMSVAGYIYQYDGTEWKNIYIILSELKRINSIFKYNVYIDCNDSFTIVESQYVNNNVYKGVTNVYKFSRLEDVDNIPKYKQF
jgi:hypothetical protein